MSSEKLPKLQPRPTTKSVALIKMGDMKSVWLPHLHLAAWRQKFDLTQEQMGNMLHLTKGTISRWEAGKRAMDIQDLERVAELLNIEPIALFMAPEDFAKAVAVHRFLKLISGMDADRAKALLDGLGAPAYEPPKSFPRPL